MIRVGLVGPAELEEIQRLAIRLEERSVEPVILDTSSPVAITVSPERESFGDLDLGDLRGLYVRDLGLEKTRVRDEAGELDLEASRAAHGRSRAGVAAWNLLLERLGRRMVVVNPPATQELHGLKPYEMAVYDELGLPIPRTLATSDASALLTLPSSPTGWIRKGVVGGYGYTASIDSPADGAAAEALLGGGVAMVQERIEGDALRAYVLGERVVGAAEILTADVDSRRGEARVARIDLPAKAAEVAVAAVRRWGMYFAAVDLMRDERAGRWVLLECNSAPFWVEFERRTGFDLASPLADFLVRRARTG